MSKPTSSEPRSESRGPDSSPGLRTLVIPRMVERGLSLDEIASITHVPPALVEFIAERCPAGTEARDSVYVNSWAAGMVHASKRLPPRTLLIRVATVIFLAGATLASIWLRAPLLPFAVMAAGGWLGPRPSRLPR